MVCELHSHLERRALVAKAAQAAAKLARQLTLVHPVTRLAVRQEEHLGVGRVFQVGRRELAQFEQRLQRGQRGRLEACRC